MPPRTSSKERGAVRPIQHDVLISEDAIRARVDELAGEIAGHLDDSRPLILGLLNGAYVFVADLARALARRGISPAVDFIAVSHYGSGTDAGREVRIVKDTRIDVRGRDVLLVDDILDSGQSLEAVVERLRAAGARSVRTCVLLDKPSCRTASLRADHVGFELDDVWVVGYGMDLDEEGRAFPYIGVVRTEETSDDTADDGQ